MATEQPTGPNPDLMPTPPSGFPAPVPGRLNSRGNVLISGIVGLALGAAVVGGAWLLFGNDGASSASVSAPARISDYVRFGDAAVFDEDSRGKETVDRTQKWDTRSSERLSAAFDGAGAVVQTYTDDSVEGTFSLEVVRAPAPYPYVPFSDPEDLGLDRPLEEVREFGDVACVIANNGPDVTAVVSCQRSTDDLTVRVTRPSGDDLREDPERVAELVSTAWLAVS